VSRVDEADVALRTLVRDARLLERAYADYLWRTAVAFGIIAAGIALGAAEPALAATLIAFGCVQVALIGHDAGHNSVFEQQQANHKLATLCWTATNGISFAYWHDRHTRHHASPNDASLDPDVAWEFGALLTPLLAFTLRLEGWRFALTHNRTTELALMCANTVAWFIPTILFGPTWLVVFLVSQVLASLYLAAVVAPNHIGMPAWSADSASTFLQRQLRSTRNVLPNPVADFVFGGMNYQIEHHLFPSMPRAHLPAARQLIKPFCAEHRLPYTESSIVNVYRAVLIELPRLAQRA
jgi:fatty acid desaturase